MALGGYLCGKVLNRSELPSKMCAVSRFEMSTVSDSMPLIGQKSKNSALLLVDTVSPLNLHLGATELKLGDNRMKRVFIGCINLQRFDNFI